MGELNSTGVSRSQNAAGPFEPKGSALDVLIVEDDALMRRRLEALIENAGYGVISVGSASEARDMNPHCGAASLLRWALASGAQPAALSKHFNADQRYSQRLTHGEAPHEPRDGNICLCPSGGVCPSIPHPSPLTTLA